MLVFAPKYTPCPRKNFPHVIGSLILKPLIFLPHFKYVAALPWEVKSSDLLQKLDENATKMDRFLHAPILSHIAY